MPPPVLLLDGGMGHQLRAMGVKVEGPVGSMSRFLGVALANTVQPELVIEAHLAYIDAGADVITTNNYAVVPAALELCDDFGTDTCGDGGDADESRDSRLSAKVRELVGDAGKAARAAVDRRISSNPNHRPVLIAGSLPPLAESYRPDRVGTFESNLDQYRLIVPGLLPYVDLLLCETMSTAEEAAAAATAAVEGSPPDMPVWVSWTLGERISGDGAGMPVLRSGESIGEAVEALKRRGLLRLGGGSGEAADGQGRRGVEALLFNCTAPEVIAPAIDALKSLNLPPGMAVGGYANGFVTAERGDGEYRRDLSPEEYWERFVTKWIATSGGGKGEQTTVIIGGCCGIFPTHIERMRAGIDATAAASAAPAAGTE